MIDLGTSLTRLAAERGFSQTSLAERVGISARRMAHYFNGDRRPDYELLLRISTVLRADLYELLGANDFRDRMGEQHSDQVVGVETAGGANGAPPHWEDFVRVPLHEVELAAGSGAQNDLEAVGAHLLFRRDWMKKQGLAPRDARLARVRGDSMMPMLFDRDVILIDMSKTTLPAGAKRPNGTHASYLVAIEQDGEARVKWAERPNESTLIIASENSTSYRPEIFVGEEAHTVRIVGRVVWWGHTVRGGDL